jgi:hypothetical protein
MITRTHALIASKAFTHCLLAPLAVAETPTPYAQPGVTTHRPEILTTPEKEIPKVEEKVEKKKGMGWSWLLLLGAVGGVAALAGSGAGGDTGGGGGGETGEVTVSW